ncbi:MAG: DNA methyltransferase [Dehalococcoidia bacterium]
MASELTKELFGDFDFALLGSPDYKEDSVREDIVLPILHALGYSSSGLNKIVRSKGLRHPFVTIGSKKRKITLIPDYLLVVQGKPGWVLDAKAPGEDIGSGENVEQAYSYAIHPDIRVKIYALCNGKEFIGFRIDEPKPIVYFQLSEIDQHWQRLYELLSPKAFSPAESVTGRLIVKDATEAFDYAKVLPLAEINNLKKQSAKRHFGVHPYFTKQVWNVVQEYIKRFTRPGDVVLDPYGGSGVTLIEAVILGRKAIHIDINPLANFIVQNLITPVSIDALTEQFEKVRRQFLVGAPHTKQEIKRALSKYDYPKGVTLPRTSDVSTVEELFSPMQLAQLAYLRYLIMMVEDQDIRGTLLLMFSGLLNKINLTYHASSVRSEGGGDSSVFRYYRYRLAPKPANLDLMDFYRSRLNKVIAAKQEIAPFVDSKALENVRIMKGTATNLHFIHDQSIDYIYTDPPYGSKIQYLDLSTMWNAWLDLPVEKQDFDLEAIEGGELNKTRESYANLLKLSIQEMYRVLKFDRWMSFVFAHKDPAYWHIIIDAAEKAGFEYMGAVKQSNDKTTFKKRQNPFTVLSGQLIISFKKTRNPKAIMKMDLGADITSLIIETIEGVIAQNHGATLEEINDELTIKGLELGFLDLLAKEYKDITRLLNQNFDFDENAKKYQIRKNSKFKSLIDVRLRIKYYLLSYMRRMEHQHHYPTFDDIILNIMPLLRNGITPQKQTILSVLEEVAVRSEEGKWKLANQQQLTLL